MSKKPSKRYTGGRKISEIGRRPDGTYTEGLWSERHALLVGQIATYWVVVEERMIWVLRALLGGALESPARQIFRSIVSNEARKKLLLTLLEKAVINRDKEAVYDEVIEEFYRLNGRRNRYVHGLWHTYQDRETAYLSERSDEEYHYLDGRRVEVGELEATVRDMDALHRKITKHIIVPAVSTRTRFPMKTTLDWRTAARVFYCAPPTITSHPLRRGTPANHKR